MNVVSKAWHDPVWSKVIAAIILAVLGAIGTYFFNLWPPIGSIVAQFFQLLAETTNVPLWLLSLLVLLSTLGFAIVCKLIFASADEAPWRQYCSDEFFGILWRWRYGDHGAINEIHSFCPFCDYEVFANERNPPVLRGFGFTTYRCDGCSRELAQLDISHADLLSKVVRLIQQTLRSKWGDAANNRRINGRV